MTSILRKMFGRKKPTALEQIELTFNPNKKQEHKGYKIPPAIKEAGKKAIQQFKQASIRVYEEKSKAKGKKEQKGFGGFNTNPKDYDVGFFRR